MLVSSLKNIKIFKSSHLKKLSAKGQREICVILLRQKLNLIISYPKLLVNLTRGQKLYDVFHIIDYKICIHDLENNLFILYLRTDIIVN